MQEFVAEQYLPSDGSRTAARCARAARRAAEQMTREGTRVQFVRSIFIPEDETCIYLYRADSIDAVRVAATRASLRLDRVAKAVTWVPAQATGDSRLQPAKQPLKGSDHVTQQG
jgi:hypothetical protein